MCDKFAGRPPLWHTRLQKTVQNIVFAVILTLVGTCSIILLLYGVESWFLSAPLGQTEVSIIRLQASRRTKLRHLSGIWWHQPMAR